MAREDIGALKITIEGVIPEDFPTPFIEKMLKERLGLRTQDTVVVRRG